MSDYDWPESTAAALLAGLHATTDADQKARETRLLGGVTLTDAEREVLWAAMRRIRVEDGAPVSILKEHDRMHALWSVGPTVERIIAARLDGAA